MKVVFLHGLESNAISDKSKWLEKNFDAWCPAVDYTKSSSFDEIYSEIIKINPSLIVGSSMGGWFAYCLSTLTGIKTLLFNPAFHSRSYDPKVRMGNTPANHIVVLGKSDELIDPTESKKWIKKNGIGNFDIRMENIGHRSPLPILQKYMSSSINEEWSTESPGNTPDLSFLPEGMRDFSVPNPMASRPFQNMGVAMTVENQKEISSVISAQKNLSNEEIQFAIQAVNPVDIFYSWLVIRGQQISRGDISKIWNDRESNLLINKMKNATKRSRPYWVSSDITVIPGTEVSSYSYPSGHSIISWIIAKKLSQRFPHLEDGLFNLAQRISQSRVDAGVHFPSDIETGKAIAECMISLGY